MSRTLSQSPYFSLGSFTVRRGRETFLPHLFPRFARIHLVWRPGNKSVAVAAVTPEQADSPSNVSFAAADVERFLPKRWRRPTPTAGVTVPGDLLLRAVRGNVARRMGLNETDLDVTPTCPSSIELNRVQVDFCTES